MLNTYTNMACELASRLASRLDSYLYLLVALEIVLLPSFHDLLQVFHQYFCSEFLQSF